MCDGMDPVWGPLSACLSACLTVYLHAQVLSLLMTFNSRTNEFAADAYAVSLDMGPALATGLIKISIG